MAAQTNLVQALGRLKDIDAGIVDPNTDSSCWLCGSTDRNVRGLNFKTKTFKPGEEFVVAPEECERVPCSAGWHNAVDRVNGR